MGPSVIRAVGCAIAVELRRWSLRLLVVGAAAVVLAQAGLYFSVELNTRAPLGYLLLLAAGVALFAFGSAGAWLRRPCSASDPSRLALPDRAVRLHRLPVPGPRVAVLASGSAPAPYF